jgi:hypothetical protein
MKASVEKYAFSIYTNTMFMKIKTNTNIKAVVITATKRDGVLT